MQDNSLTSFFSSEEIVVLGFWNHDIRRSMQIWFLKMKVVIKVAEAILNAQVRCLQVFVPSLSAWDTSII